MRDGRPLFGQWNSNRDDVCLFCSTWQPRPLYHQRLKKNGCLGTLLCHLNRQCQNLRIDAYWILLSSAGGNDNIFTHGFDLIKNCIDWPFFRTVILTSMRKCKMCVIITFYGCIILSLVSLCSVWSLNQHWSNAATVFYLHACAANIVQREIVYKVTSMTCRLPARPCYKYHVLVYIWPLRISGRSHATACFTLRKRSLLASTGLPSVWRRFKEIASTYTFKVDAAQPASKRHCNYCNHVTTGLAKFSWHPTESMNCHIVTEGEGEGVPNSSHADSGIISPGEKTVSDLALWPGTVGIVL